MFHWRGISRRTEECANTLLCVLLVVKCVEQRWDVFTADYAYTHMLCGLDSILSQWGICKHSHLSISDMIGMHSFCIKFAHTHTMWAEWGIVEMVMS